MSQYYEYRHVVGFQETNVVGNVYFVHHLSWQGRCREMFLRDHCPELLGAIAGGLRLVTLSCHCDYFDELAAFDEIHVRMRLAGLEQNRLRLSFDYMRSERRVARGEQVVACMTAGAEGLEPAEVPEALLRALRPYQ